MVENHTNNIRYYPSSVTETNLYIQETYKTKTRTPLYPKDPTTVTPPSLQQVRLRKSEAQVKEEGS